MPRRPPPVLIEQKLVDMAQLVLSAEATSQLVPEDDDVVTQADTGRCHLRQPDVRYIRFGVRTVE